MVTMRMHRAVLSLRIWNKSADVSPPQELTHARCKSRVRGEMHAYMQPEAAGVDLPKREYAAIARQMLPAEIPREVVVKLDAIHAVVG